MLKGAGRSQHLSISDVEGFSKTKINYLAIMVDLAHEGQTHLFMPLYACSRLSDEKIFYLVGIRMKYGTKTVKEYSVRRRFR